MAENTSGDTAKIMHEIGKLSGTVTSLVGRVDDVRSDIHRAYREHTDQLTKLRIDLTRMVESSEARMERRIDGVCDRVERLEAEDKRIIEKVAGLAVVSGGLGGGVGSALVLGAVELMKRML